MAKALIVRTNGTVDIADISTLKDLQDAVGGYIELIHFTDKSVAFLNEDGKALNLDFNKNATLLCAAYNVGLMDTDYIAGNMVIIGNINPETNEPDGEDHDLPDGLLTDIINFCFE